MNGGLVEGMKEWRREWRNGDELVLHTLLLTKDGIFLLGLKEQVKICHYCILVKILNEFFDLIS